MRTRLHTLDRYLLQQMAPPFLIALGAILIALLLERLLVLFDYLAAAGSSLATCFALLTDLLPHYFGIALPSSLCIAVFVTIRGMNDHNEIDALRAAHISLIRINTPFMLVGLGLGIASILLYGYIQPVARYDYRAGFYLAEHAGWTPHLQAGMFTPTSGRTVLTVDQADHGGTVLKHIFIREVTEHGTMRLITAQTGLLTGTSLSHPMQIDLWNGEILDSSSFAHLPVRSHITHFRHAVKRIDSQSRKSHFRSRGADERELTLFELAHDLRHGVQGIEYRTLRAEFDFRMARALAIPFIPPLAVALATTAKRRRSIWGLLAVAGILIGFDQILLLGHSLASLGTIPIWVGLWVPEALFCSSCLMTLLKRSRIA